MCDTEVGLCFSGTGPASSSSSSSPKIFSGVRVQSAQRERLRRSTTRGPRVPNYLLSLYRSCIIQRVCWICKSDSNIQIRQFEKFVIRPLFPCLCPDIQRRVYPFVRYRLQSLLQSTVNSIYHCIKKIFEFYLDLSVRFFGRVYWRKELYILKPTFTCFDKYTRYRTN